MDITDSPNLRMEAGVDHLKSGGSLSYHNVVFYLDNQMPQIELSISSYSDSIHLENVQPTEAKEKIERSKIIAEDLAAKSPAFKSLWQKSVKRYNFCFDYGKGAILLAEEFEGQLDWKQK